jgi:hypothetical protein
MVMVMVFLHSAQKLPQRFGTQQDLLRMVSSLNGCVGRSGRYNVCMPGLLMTSVCVSMA